MADILGGRFGRLVQALFNLNQPLTLGQALPDVMPVIDIEQPRPEMEIFSGNDLAHGWGNATAVAAFPSVALLNPENSGRVVIITGITAAFSIVNQTAVLTTCDASSWIAVAGTTVSAERAFRDTRRTINPTTSFPAAVLAQRSTTLAGALQQFARHFIPPVETVEISEACPIVLAPDRGLVVTSDAAISANLACQFTWRERSLGQQELSV